MFYAHIVLAKKGPLARIWLAAHWDKKLTKAHVFETNIEQSVDGIMQPKVKLALRTSGHLLLGVVRIYSRKAKYLLADCNEAFVKIKMAFRPGMVDLPEGHREAAVNAITLPEVFHDFDTALPELNDVDIEAQFSINQSRADEITMREDYGTLSMSMHDDGFGDMGFDADTPDAMRDAMDPTIDHNLFDDDMARDIEDSSKEPMPGTSRGILDEDLADPHMDEDGFGDDFGQPAAGLFEGDIFGETTLVPQVEDTSALPQDNLDHSDDDLDHFDTGAPSPLASSIGSRPPSVLGQEERIRPPTVMQQVSSPQHMDVDGEENLEHLNQQTDDIGPEVGTEEAAVSISNEDESFALAPVDATAYKGVTKAKRKRKLIVDEIKNISGEEMKSQLANTSDIVTTLDLAPPTKRLMYWKETGGVEKLFSLPSRLLPTKGLFINYQRHLNSHSGLLEDFSCLGPLDLLALGQIQLEHESPYKRGRKRKLPLPVSEQQQQALQNVAQQELLQISQQQFQVSPQQQQQASPQQHLHVSPKMQDQDQSSVMEPEQIREIDLHNRISSVSMDMAVMNEISGVNETLMPPPPTPGPSGFMDSIHSPSNLPPDLSGLGPMTPGFISNIPMTPGGLDLHDDFHSTGLTPGGLHHGGMTPHHVHGGMTPHHMHGGMTPHHGGMTPLHSHGGMTPHPDHLDAISASLAYPPVDDPSSILNPENIPSSLMHTLEGLEDDLQIENPNSSAELANDWNDYDFPPSVGEAQPGDEQQENETDEQFEERVLNKRAQQMFTSVKSRLQKKDELWLSEMTARNNRKQAAQKFYALLVLKKFQALEIRQAEPYGDISVKRGVMFDNPKL